MVFRFSAAVFFGAFALIGFGVAVPALVETCAALVACIALIADK